MEDMESLLIPQISMDVDDTPLNLEEGSFNADETSATTDSDNEENIQMRLRNLLELENFDPAQTPEKLTAAELESKERIFSEGHPPIEYVRMHCSSCNCHLGTAPLNQDNRYIHPLLNVLVCKNCYEFYCSGDFEKDEDGSELYCRWCGQGGKVMCCSGCAYVFCQRCVRQNLGKRTLDLIIESDDWYCFACNPSQLVNLRILCATLFDYVKQEISEVKQSGDIERLKRDFSMCCSNKSAQQKYAMPVRRRRRAPSEDQTYHPSRDKDLMESRRSNHMLKKALNSSGAAAANSGITGNVIVNKPLPPLQKGVLQSPPPLVGISASNTINIRFNQTTPNPRTITTVRGFPSIQPRPTILNSIRPQLSGAKPVQVLCATNNRPITSNTVTNMAASLNNQLTNAARGSQNFIPLNNTQTAGIVRLTSNNNIINQQSRRVSSLPTHFPPGIRNNWFNQAATITSTIVARLSTSLVDLSTEQANATSVEQLATVHNKLQELLSSSVNSMIQVRKNLRNEFLNDLNKMKFTAVPKQQHKTAVVARLNNNKLMNSQPVIVDDDDDVIIVNNEEEDPLAITTTTTTAAVPSVVDETKISSTPAVVNFVSPEVKVSARECMSSQILPGPGIKIKVKTDLFKEDSAKINGKPIELSSDLSEIEEVDVKAEEDTKPNISVLDETKEAGKTVAPAVDSESVVETVETAVDTESAVKADDLANVDKETYLQIQHALAESKLEALIEENSKYKVDTSEICPEELAKILTVRVVLTTNFSSFNATPRKRRRVIKQEADSPAAKLMSVSVDFEEILHGNLINTEQAKPHFDQAFSSFVEQTKSKEVLDEEIEEDGCNSKEDLSKLAEEVPFGSLSEADKDAESDQDNEAEEEEEIPEEIIEEVDDKVQALDSSDEKMQTEQQIDVR